MLLNKQLDNEEIKSVLGLISSSMPSRAPGRFFYLHCQGQGGTKTLELGSTSNSGEYSSKCPIT